MIKINDSNNFRNKLCKNKSINIAEALKNRIKFEQVHELNKQHKWNQEQIDKLSKTMKQLEEALKQSSFLRR